MVPVREEGTHSCGASSLGLLNIFILICSTSSECVGVDTSHTALGKPFCISMPRFGAITKALMSVSLGSENSHALSPVESWISRTANYSTCSIHPMSSDVRVECSAHQSTPYKRFHDLQVQCRLACRCPNFLLKPTSQPVQADCMTASMYNGVQSCQWLAAS